MSTQTRRSFLQRTTLSSAATASVLLSQFDQVAKAQASERVRVGIMGSGGRAMSLIHSFASNKSVEVVAIADLDANKLPKGLDAAEKLQGTRPRGESDFRKLIDDKKIDALVIGTPDHWHAIPTILACQNGKDVYVEKPDSHNIIEGMRMVAAMRKHKRVVQMGSQHRSTTRLQSAIEFVKSGKLGRCVVAKAWESSKQGPIGFPPDGTPPAGVQYRPIHCMRRRKTARLLQTLGRPLLPWRSLAGWGSTSNTFSMHVGCDERTISSDSRTLSMGVRRGAKDPEARGHMGK